MLSACRQGLILIFARALHSDLTSAVHSWEGLQPSGCGEPLSQHLPQGTRRVSWRRESDRDLASAVITSRMQTRVCTIEEENHKNTGFAIFWILYPPFIRVAIWQVTNFCRTGLFHGPAHWPRRLVRVRPEGLG